MTWKEWLKQFQKETDGQSMKRLGGYIVLLVWGEEVLIRAYYEASNRKKGKLLLTPTFQSSKSDLVALDRGVSQIANLCNQTKEWTVLHQDGGRFFEKKNYFSIVYLEEKIDPLENERWFTMDELVEAILQGYANEHLVQAFALLMAKNFGKEPGVKVDILVPDIPGCLGLEGVSIFSIWNVKFVQKWSEREDFSRFSIDYTETVNTSFLIAETVGPNGEKNFDVAAIIRGPFSEVIKLDLPQWDPRDYE